MSDLFPELQFSESESQLLKILTLPKAEAIACWENWKTNFLPGERSKNERRQLSRVFSLLRTYGVDIEELKPIEIFFARSRKQIKNYLEALDPVLEWLNSSKIPVMILKTGSFLALGQERVGSRAMFDLDILVPYEDAERVYQYLLDTGWTLRDNPMPTGEGKRFYHSVDLVNSNGGKIDLHWHVMYDSLNQSLDSRCWQRARKALLGHREVFVLSAEDLFLLICVHGWQRYKFRYDWVPDIKVLLVAEKETIDWNYLLFLARKRHLVETFQKCIRFLTLECKLDLPSDFVKSVENLELSLPEKLTAFGKAKGNHTPLGGLPYRIATVIRMSPPGVWGFLTTFLIVLKKAWGIEGSSFYVFKKIVGKLWSVQARFLRAIFRTKS